jgi:hypothetical protein
VREGFIEALREECPSEGFKDWVREYDGFREPLRLPRF